MTNPPPGGQPGAAAVELGKSLRDRRGLKAPSAVTRGQEAGVEAALKPLPSGWGPGSAP